MKCIDDRYFKILLFIHLSKIFYSEFLHILLNQVFETLNQRLPLSPWMPPCANQNTITNRSAAPAADNKHRSKFPALHRQWCRPNTSDTG